MKRHLVWLVAVPLLAGCDLDVSGLGSCDYDESWSESISAAGITTLRVLADAGDLRIEGRPGINSIRVHATACSDDPNTLKQIDFELFYSGSAVDLETFVTRRHNARLDLVVQVPLDMAAAIYHASGDIWVRDIDYVFIDDQSGHIDIDHIRFDVDIEDESGDIDIFDVGGDVVVEDGSGDIDEDGVFGDLIVLFDSSGAIRYRNVRGLVDLP